VVNGVCFWLASLFVPGFIVHGLLAFLLAPVVLSLSTTFLNKYFVEKGLVQSPQLKSEQQPQTLPLP
jgi:putative membrane protein